MEKSEQDPADKYNDHVTDTGHSESDDGNDDGADDKQPLLFAEKKTTRPNLLLYLSHFLSAWGDRMWMFGVGLFLVEISPGSLQLTAIYGLVTGATVLLGGPLVGGWVDNTRRITAAQATIVLQNTLTMLCAGVVYAYLTYTSTILDWGSWSRDLSYAIIITLSASANLASIANTIAVERDWIVEICAQDQSRLATTTATMRAIDLTTQILAPIATGFIMRYASIANGALFIGGWNLCSMVVEYLLIWQVYTQVPELRHNKDKRAARGETNYEDAPLISSESETEATTSADETKSSAKVFVSDSTRRSNKKTDPGLGVGASDEVRQLQEQREENSSIPDRIDRKQSKSKAKRSGCWRVFSGIVIIVQGWRTFASYPVMLSGLALSLLYMTVLGFDNVTVGFVKLQGMSEAVVGVAMGAGGLVGILGAWSYPCLSRRLGLPASALVALCLELACLSACVVSVWLPGSPFDLFSGQTNCTRTPDNNDTAVPTFSATATFHTSGSTPTPLGALQTCDDDNSIWSVTALLAGIVTARFGLWVTDLSITQMFLQTIHESERGVVSGVQSSLNQLMDMLKFVLVVALPLPEQFGLLVIISFLAIALGVVLYLIFLCRLPRGMFARGETQNTNETETEEEV